MRVDPYSTHLPLLVAAMLDTQGPILEMGGGHYSTPLISVFANAQRREAHTIETGATVYGLLKIFSSQYHKIWPMNGYDFAPDGKFMPRADATREQYIAIQSRFLEDFCRKAPQRWSVVFIDHAPGYLRVPAIEHFADNADFIITHDTELSDAYGYEPCLSTFQHRWDFHLQSPNTTIMSNIRDCGHFKSWLGQTGEGRI
jgi:hypothetical protein